MTGAVSHKVSDIDNLCNPYSHPVDKRKHSPTTEEEAIRLRRSKGTWLRYMLESRRCKLRSVGHHGLCSYHVTCVGLGQTGQSHS